MDQIKITHGTHGTPGTPGTPGTLGTLDLVTSEETPLRQAGRVTDHSMDGPDAFTRAGAIGTNSDVDAWWLLSGFLFFVVDDETGDVEHASVSLHSQQPMIFRLGIFGRASAARKTIFHSYSQSNWFTADFWYGTTNPWTRFRHVVPITKINWVPPSCTFLVSPKTVDPGWLPAVSLYTCSMRKAPHHAEAYQT